MPFKRRFKDKYAGSSPENASVVLTLFDLFFKNLSDWKMKFKTMKREIEHALRHLSDPSNKKRKTRLTQFKCQAHSLTRIRCSFVKDLNSMKARYRRSMVLLDSVPPTPHCSSVQPDSETNNHSLSQLESEWVSERMIEHSGGHKRSE